MIKAKKETTSAKKKPATSAAAAPVKKVAAKKTVVKASAAFKPAPLAKKPTVTVKAKAAAPIAVPAPKQPVFKAFDSKPAVTPEQRTKMIEEAAYFIAEKHGFQGDSSYFWTLAEQEVAAKLDK